MSIHRSDSKLLLLRRVINLKVFILLAVIIALIYSNTFEAPFVFDDRAVVFDELTQITSLSQVNFNWLGKLIGKTRSVAVFSFAANFYLGGLDVFGYHLVNMVVHILTAWTVFAFIRLTMDLAGSAPLRAQRTALVASLLFAVHPIQTQAVTFIVQRETSLACLFYLWTLLFYIKGRLSGRRGFFFLCLLSAVLAVGSKQTAAVLPITVFLYEFYFFQNGEKEWLKKNRALMGLIVLVPVVIGFIYVGPNMVSWIMERYAKREFSPMERVLTEQRVILHYLTLLVFPLPSRFCLQYNFPISAGFSPITVIAIAFHAMALVIAVRSAKSRPLISFFIIWFYLNHIIESSVLGLELVYEHRMYLPSIGLFYIVGFCCHEFANVSNSFRKFAFLVLCVVLLSCLGLSTYLRNRVWQSNESLWEDVLKKNPGSFRAHQNLGNAYLESGKVEQAKREFEAALRLDDENVTALNNMGVVLKQEEKWDVAQEYFRRAMKLRPGYPDPISNLAEMYAGMGRYRESEGLFKVLIDRAPQDYRVRSRLAAVFLAAGEFDDASAEFIRVIHLKPDLKVAFSGLWESLQGMQHIEKAETFLKETIAGVKQPVIKRELSAMLRAVEKQRATDNIGN